MSRVGLNRQDWEENGLSRAKARSQKVDRRQPGNGGGGAANGGGRGSRYQAPRNGGGAAGEGGMIASFRCHVFF